MKKSIATTLAIVFTLALAGAALAHSISLWASVEDGKVRVEAYAADGKKIQHATIYVLDAAGKVLLKGETSEKGEFVFDPPVKDDLTIVLKVGGHGGGGHTAEAKIKKAEFDAAEKKTE